MQRRRRKQSGSVVPISGRWFVRFYRDVNENGSIMRKKVSYCLGPIEGSKATKNPPPKIREAAEAYVREKLGQKIVSERAGLTVGQFVERIYLPMLAETKREATSGQAKSIWNRLLEPQVLYLDGKEIRAAELMVADAEPYHVQAWLDAVADNSDFVRSTSTLKQCKFLLSGAFRTALIRGYRSKAAGHPVEDCMIPSRSHGAGVTHAYSDEEIRQIITELDEPARTVVLLAAETGLRAAELKGLRWEDLNGDTLTVSRSVWKKFVNEPKTEASKAPVHISTRLQAALELHRAKDGWPTTGPMFRTSVGTTLSLDNIRTRMILPKLQRCELCHESRRDHAKIRDHEFKLDAALPKWFGWHAFRRSLATDLSQTEKNIKVAQGALRHSDAAVTLRHYAKTVDDDVRRAVEERSARLGISLTDTYRTAVEQQASEPQSVN